MKINKIKIKNLNSLRGDWELDFTNEPFLSASLFSITGPTGSGKSTLLDGITLALFNQIPRINKPFSKTIVEEGGFMLSRNETECMSEVEYTCKSGRFRSSWSISVNRNGNLRDYEMEITDLSTNQILDVKRKDIPDTNANLIGLNYDQFIRSILLSQGGFSKFLDADKEDRAKLLEQITGTDIYRRLGIHAYNKWKEVNEPIEHKKKTIEDEKKELMNEDEKTQKEKILESLKTKINSLKQDQNKLNALLVVKRNIVQYKKRISENTAKLDECIIKEETFRTLHLDKLIRHRNLISYIDEIKFYCAALKRKEEVVSILEKLKTEKAEKNEKKNDIQLDIEKLIRKTVPSDEIEKVLLLFRDEVLDMEKKRDEAKIDLDHQKTKIAELLEKSPIEKPGADFDFFQNEQWLYDQIEEKMKDQKDLESKGMNKSNFKVLKTELSEKKQLLKDLKDSVEQYEAVVKERDKLKNEIKELLSLLTPKEEINKKEAAYCGLIKKKDELLKNIIRLNKENSDNIVALRSALQENEPCMVCGSLHHPYLHEYVLNINEEAKRLEIIESDLSLARKNCDELINQNKINTSLIQTKEVDVENKEKQVQEIVIKINDYKLKTGIKEIKSVQNVSGELDKTTDFLTNIESYEKTDLLLESLIEIKNEIEEARVKKQILVISEKNLLARYSGKGIMKESDDFISKINDIERFIAEIQTKEKEYTKEFIQLLEDCTNTEEKILAPIQFLQYQTISDAEKDILDQVLYEKLSNEEKSISNQIENFNLLINQAKEWLDAEIKNDDVTISEERCLDLLNKTEAILTETENEKTNLSFVINTDQERIKKIAALERDIAAISNANKKWDYLNKLIGDKYGNTFNNFAQKFTLNKLVKLGNIHLRKLNERYLLDLPGEGEEKDLVVVDAWMGEERRSVKTLSGGEKFLISLSLALALSDLASRHVKIESLFIDEGFGTLDPETLDQAISTLEQLQSGTGKSVGIISHVEELKQRIQTQIRVEKSATGFSSIRVITGIEEE